MTCIENDKIEVDHSMDYYEIDERAKHQLPYIHSKRTHFKTPTLNHQSKMTFNGIFFCSARTHIVSVLFTLSLSLAHQIDFLLMCSYYCYSSVFIFINFSYRLQRNNRVKCFLCVWRQCNFCVSDSNWLSSLNFFFSL